MPRGIDPKLKQELLEAGKWGEFVKYRQDLKIGGMPARDAHYKALAKFLENPPPMPQVRPRGRPRKHDPSKPLPTPMKYSCTANETIPVKEAAKPPSMKTSESVDPVSPPAVSTDIAVGGGGSAALADPSLPFSSEKPRDSTATPAPVPTAKSHVGDLSELPAVYAGDFEDKRASEVEEVRWVASNMEIMDPSPSSCPSAAAWGLLAQCRGSMMAKSDFWKQTYPKLLPSRAQMDAEPDSAPDESKAKEVIEDLLRFGREAKEKEGDQDGKPEAEEESELNSPEEDSPGRAVSGDRDEAASGGLSPCRGPDYSS